MEMHRSREIQAGIKCFFVSSVYGLALGISLGGGIPEEVFDCGGEVTPQDFFAREEFLNMNPTAEPPTSRVQALGRGSRRA